MSRNGNTNNKIKITRTILLIGTILISNSVVSAQADDYLSLNETVRQALESDAWLVGNQFSQKSIDAMSVSVATLPDPQISLTMANFPTDNFNFGQEAMTQFKVGISQVFPRGDSLKFKRKQLELKSSSYPYQRKNRKAQITVTVSQLWLDIYKAQMSIILIEKNRVLFEQLSEAAESSYASAIGRTRQQDIIRAELELTRLDDRLTILKQELKSNLAQMNQWLGNQSLNNNAMVSHLDYFKIHTVLPEIAIINPNIYIEKLTDNDIFQFMENHPIILALRKQIASTEINIDLAKQKYKPAFGFNASYGYRGMAPTGENRSDFLSLGVTFDLPLFTKNKQDQELKAAVAESEAIKTEEWLLVKKMLTSFQSAKAQLLRLSERQKLYQNKLLPQMHELVEASLNAYTNGDSDFSEVVRSSISELNAQIDALAISVDKQKTIAQLNYFFVTEKGGE